MTQDETIDKTTTHNTKVYRIRRPMKKSALKRSRKDKSSSWYGHSEAAVAVELPAEEIFRTERRTSSDSYESDVTDDCYNSSSSEVTSDKGRSTWFY